MDEEDGRPGHRAGQLGRTNAATGVAMKILCRQPAVGQMLAIRSHKIRGFSGLDIETSGASHRTHCKSQFFAKHRKSNHMLTIPAPFSWRGPAKGVRPTAGGEQNENVPGK
jgi:hypothetical protein